MDVNYKTGVSTVNIPFFPLPPSICTYAGKHTHTNHSHAHTHTNHSHTHKSLKHIHTHTNYLPSMVEPGTAFPTTNAWKPEVQAKNRSI